MKVMILLTALSALWGCSSPTSVIGTKGNNVTVTVDMGVYAHVAGGHCIVEPLDIDFNHDTVLVVKQNTLLTIEFDIKTSSGQVTDRYDSLCAVKDTIIDYMFLASK